jgi:hypothetical protein
MKKYSIEEVIKIIEGNNKRKFIGITDREKVDKNFVIFAKHNKICIVFIDKNGNEIYSYFPGGAIIHFKDKEFKEIL